MSSIVSGDPNSGHRAIHYKARSVGVSQFEKLAVTERCQGQSWVFVTGVDASARAFLSACQAGSLQHPAGGRAKFQGDAAGFTGGFVGWQTWNGSVGGEGEAVRAVKVGHWGGNSRRVERVMSSYSWRRRHPSTKSAFPCPA